MTAAGEGAAVYLFLVWSCTRTYASLVFLLISISGSVGPRASPLRLCRAARVMRSCSAARVMRFSCRAARTRDLAPSNPSPRIRSPGSLCRLRSQSMAPGRAPNAPVQQKPEGEEWRGVMQVRMRRVRGVGGTERGWGGVGCVCVLGGGGECRSCCRLATRSC